MRHKLGEALCAFRGSNDVELSAAVLNAIGQEARRVGKVGWKVWSPDSQRWCSMPRVASDLTDAERLFRDVGRGWDWRVGSAGQGHYCAVSRAGHTSPDLLSWKPAAALCLGLLYARGALPSVGAWVRPEAASTPSLPPIPPLRLSWDAPSEQERAPR